MSPGILLFGTLRYILNSTKYTASYNKMNKMAPNKCEIHIDNSVISKYRGLDTGERYNDIAVVTFNLNGEYKEGSITDMEDTIEKLKTTLNTTHNRNYYVKVLNEDSIDVKLSSEIGYEKVCIVTVGNLTGALPLADTDQNIPRYSIKFRVEYRVGG